MRRFLLSISLLLAAVFSLDARGVSVVTEPVEVTSLTDATNVSFLSLSLAMNPPATQSP